MTGKLWSNLPNDVRNSETVKNLISKLNYLSSLSESSCPRTLKVKTCFID